jgi:NAD(P)H-hydrate epimerase
VIHIAHPAALVQGDPGDRFTEAPANPEMYSAIGIGPGLGRAPETLHAFKKLLEAYHKPMVIDADALNLLSNHRELLPLIPSESILTPHAGELRRLIGPWHGDREKLEKTTELASAIDSYIVIKGAWSVICGPEGHYWFNSTGNAGMAKGGSGDVLTGLLTGLLAKGKPPKLAAMLGNYLHGKAGDEAAARWGKEAMNAEDIAVAEPGL